MKNKFEKMGYYIQEALALVGFVWLAAVMGGLMVRLTFYALGLS